MRDFGVSVHIVESGFFSTSIGSDTKGLVRIMENAWKTLPEEIQQSYGGDDFLKKREYIRDIFLKTISTVETSSLKTVSTVGTSS